MKKILCIMISIVMVFSPTTTAFATLSSQGFEGEILYQESISDAVTSSSESSVLATVSYKINADGTCTFYEYRDYNLIEEHISDPLGGTIYHT